MQVSRFLPALLLPLTTFALSHSSPLTAAEPTAAAEPRSKWLFVDDQWIAERQRVTRELGRVTKENQGRPIFTAGRFYGTVLRDDGRFKLWYRKPGAEGYGYAESTDGLRFERRGDIAGLNFAGDYTLAVEVDPTASAARRPRFIASYDAPGMAAGIAQSADGLRWTPLNDGRPVTGRAADSYNQIVWDPLAKTYRLFTRTDFGSAGGASELRGTRSMTNASPWQNPTNWRTVSEWKFDRTGPAEALRRQIYATTCWIYADVYFALLTVYEYPGDVSEGVETDRQRRHERDVMNCYLATSRDAQTWDLAWVYAERPLVPRGPAGAFDKDLLLPASTIVTHQDRHWIYYCGADERHGTEQVRFDRHHALGVATLPLDRFAGWTAAADEGTIVTEPIVLPSGRPQLNVDARQGSLSIEVLSANGEPLAGLSGPARSSLDSRDELRWSPTWSDSETWRALRGKTVRFRFRLRNATLYALSLSES